MTVEIFPFTGNKQTFDFLIKPYLNIKTMGTLAGVCTVLRKYVMYENNKLWFDYYHHTINKKYKLSKRNMVRVVDFITLPYSIKGNNMVIWKFPAIKKYEITYEANYCYYYRAVFDDLYDINEGLMKDIRNLLSSEQKIINVTTTQIKQIEILYPDMPHHMEKAIGNCKKIMQNSIDTMRSATKELNFLLLCMELKTNIKQAIVID